MNWAILGVLSITRGTLATQFLLHGATLIKSSLGCKLYWKKGDLVSASADFKVVSASNVTTMMLPQGVCMLMLFFKIQENSNYCVFDLTMCLANVG